MILIPFFFLIFFNYIKCDIPVHCLSRHVEGIWEIKLGLLKTKNSENKKLGISKNNTFEHNLDSYSYDYECGYRRPDNSEFHDGLNPEKVKENFEEKKKKLFVFNNDRTVNIIENGYINQEYKGFWRLIYDEALYIEIYKGSKQKEVYFSFFKFKEKGYVSYSYCNSLIIGAVNVYYLNDNCTNNVCNNTPSTSNKIRENKNTKFTEYDHIERNIYKNKKYLNHEQNDLYYVLKKNINYLERKHKLNNYKILHNIYKGSLSKKENKEINTKNYFYELIDFYNDNFINLNFLTVDRYCWYGKKLNATSENPTNKIPTNIVSPLLVDVNIHNKNYETIKAQRNKSIKNNQEKNEKIYKEKIEGINISSLNLYNKSNSKKYKKNRLFDSYSYKNITLSNFDWTNKSDVKKRLGNYVKIVDNAIDQKDCGSCYANSAALIINSRVRIKYNYIKNIDFLFFSNEQMLICDFFNQGCSGGYIYISLKYAYENFLYTDECFKKYKNRYINKDKKNNYLCDRFDTFKIFLHKRKNYIQNIEGKRKEENMNAFRINLIEKKKREIWRNGENSLIKDIKVHTNNNKNEMKNHIEKSGKAYKVEIRNKEMNEKKEENSYEIDYDEINDENKDKDNDNANRNDKSSSDESSNDESSSDESSNDESSSDDSNDESSNDESNDNEIDDDGINDDELYENYILMNKKKYETNKLDMMSLNRCDIKIKVRKYEYLEIENEEDIKKYLYYNGPIAAAIEPSKQFAKYEKGILREDFIKMHDGKKSNAYIWHKVDHAVVIVGWGEETLENFMKKNNLNESDIDNIIDIKEKEKNKIIKYWKILNSWGTKWGNNGYFYILRGQNYYNIKSYLLMCDVNLFLKK